jgi:perosamine synthetase
MSAAPATSDARTPLPIARPLLGEEESEAVARVLRTGWVSQGPEVASFEAEFAQWVGASHACAVSSCTAALHLALVALGVEHGDEVITASHSFIASANAIRYTGAIPVFIDVDPVNGNMLPTLIEAAISSKTKAILVVHQLGMPADLSAILPIAKNHGLPVVEDAACAMGSAILVDDNWHNIGRPHGEIACFSFHPRKVITTGDGGMLTTNNPELKRRLDLLRQHGMSISDRIRHSSSTMTAESYDILGYNYRMTDIQAAVGRVQLTRLPGIIAERRRQAALYSELLGDVPWLQLPKEPPWAKSNWQTYCVQLSDLVDRNAVMQKLLEAGISTRRGVMCSHREQAYQKKDWRCPRAESSSEPYCPGCHQTHCELLANGQIIQDRGVALPLYPGLTPSQQHRIAEQLRIAGGEAQVAQPVESVGNVGKRVARYR